MDTNKFSKIIELLNSATEKNSLVWTEVNTNFSTSISGCKIIVSSCFDSLTNEYFASVAFFNDEGVQFDNVMLYQTSDEEIYNEVMKLYNLISDKYYKKTESENKIIDGLKGLLG